MGTSAHCQDAELPTSIVSLVVESVDLILALTCAVCVVVTPKETNSSRATATASRVAVMRLLSRSTQIRGRLLLTSHSGSKTKLSAIDTRLRNLLLKSRYCRGLPREARELCNLNCLGKRLGKLDPIEFQYISASTAQTFRASRPLTTAYPAIVGTCIGQPASGLHKQHCTRSPSTLSELRFAEAQHGRP